MVQGHQTFSTGIELVECFGSTSELAVLVVLAHKSLDHTDGADVLLHTLVQLVVLYEDLLEQTRHA